MKALNLILSAIFYLVLAALGIGLIVFFGAAPAEYVAKVQNWLHEMPAWIPILSGSVLLVFLAAIPLTGALARRKRQFITFENESGKVTVDTEAVSRYLLTLRDEYPALLGVDNSAVREAVMMATRYIFEKLEKGATLRFKPDFHKKVAYHTPCHMEKLGWRVFSERLLKMIPGMEFTLLDSACCGIAGTYGFKKENYSSSQAIGQPLFDQIKAIDPEVVACDCETCKWQIEMSTGYQVMNPISILAEAIDYEK